MGSRAHGDADCQELNPAEPDVVGTSHTSAPDRAWVRREGDYRWATCFSL